MNIQKALNRVLIKNDLNLKQYADNVGIAYTSISTMKRTNNANLKTLERMATGAGLKLSEFIALGE